MNIMIIKENFHDLFDKRAFANLATLMPDGSPQLTPVWIDFDGENLLVNTAIGQVKDKNMRSRKQVAISILDPENPYRYLSVFGRVIEIIDGDKANAHIDKLAKKYLGQDRYPNRAPSEVRVLYKIKPEKVVLFPPESA